MVEPQARLPRDAETRATAERVKSWQPAATLPEPDKQPGYSYRWVRAALNGTADPQNMSAKMREGWEMVRIEEQPQFKMFLDPNSRFKDNVEISGLLLCKMPDEFVAQRAEHFNSKTRSQMESVDNSFMRENDPRMPLFSERKSSSSFGKGK
jgi:hypothetical protein